MVEVLFTILIILLWFTCRTKRDWYIVEWRSCSNRELALDFLGKGRFTFDRSRIKLNSLTIHQNGKQWTILRYKDGNEISVSQDVFENLDAARLYFERLKQLHSQMQDRPFHKFYLLKVIAFSRGKALNVPPERYRSDSDETTLIEFPQYSEIPERSLFNTNAEIVDGQK